MRSSSIRSPAQLLVARLSLALLLLLLLLCQPCSALNAVVNGGFESGGLRAWTVLPAASGSEYYLYRGVSHSGHYCFAFAGDAAGYYDSLEQTVAVTRNRAFQLSLWLSLGYGADGWAFSVSQNGVHLMAESDAAYAEYDWAEFCMTFTSDGSGSVTLVLAGNTADSASDLAAIFVDDIALLELPSGTVVGTGLIPCYAASSSSSSSSSSGQPSSSSSSSASSSSSSLPSASSGGSSSVDFSGSSSVDFSGSSSSGILSFEPSSSSSSSANDLPAPAAASSSSSSSSSSFLPLASSGSSASSLTLNEIVNGGFEDGDEDGDPTGWTVTDAAQGACAELYPSGHSGGHCFLFCNGHTGQYDSLGQVLALPPSRVFQLSLWLRPLGPGSALQVLQDGVQLVDEADVPGPYSQWGEYCLQLTSDGSGSTTLQLSGNSDDGLLVDDIAIQELPLGAVASTGLIPCYAASSSSSSSSSSGQQQRRLKSFTVYRSSYESSASLAAVAAAWTYLLRQ